MADVRHIVLLLCVLLAGCGGGGGGGGGDDVNVDWDLTSAHTTEEVSWPKPDLGAVEIKPVGSVRIALPGGRTIEEDEGVVSGITMKRDGETVDNIALDTPPLTLDAARDRARAWAEELDLPTAPIDRWHAAAQSDPTATTGSEDPDQRLGGPDGPRPILALLHSFDAERPTVVSLQLQWPAR